MKKYNILTEHTLEDFLKWYKEDYSKKLKIPEYGYVVFSSPFEFQIGILISFAESRGFKISITYSEKYSYWNYYVSHCDFGSTNETTIRSYKKASKLALKEFNTRYNNIFYAL